MCVKHATCQQLHKTTCAHAESYSSSSPSLAHSMTPSRTQQHIHTPDLIKSLSHPPLLYISVIYPSTSLQLSIHPLTSRSRLHYLLPTSLALPLPLPSLFSLWALWVVNPHTNNMVPVSIISLGWYDEGGEEEGEEMDTWKGAGGT